MVYQGEPVNLLLTVTLMEHDSGNPNQYMSSSQDAAMASFAVFLTIHPQLTLALLVAPSEIVAGVNSIGAAVSQALGTGDDVIGTATKLITVGEMKEIANRPGPKPTARGIPFDFFTDHRGHGGIYRVYFDIIPL
jgi:hypothetical protein